MLAASLFFATMAVCIKIASAWFSAAELVFWRGLIGMGVMALWARSQGTPLRTRYPGMHAWRSMVGVLSLGAWFYAIAGLPLATAMTLNYMSSVWVAAFLVGGALMAWRPGAGAALPARHGALAATVMAGFAGVLLMLRPTIAQHEVFAGLVGLLSGMLSAIAYLQVTGLARLGEPEVRTVFYFAAGSALAGGLGMAATGLSAWDWQHALWLVPMALLASLGQWCMTRAYSHGATLVVANLQYSGIVFGALYSLLLFGDRIAPEGWLGMALICASGIVATVLRAPAAPEVLGEER